MDTLRQRSWVEDPGFCSYAVCTWESRAHMPCEISSATSALRARKTSFRRQRQKRGAWINPWLKRSRTQFTSHTTSIHRHCRDPLFKCYAHYPFIPITEHPLQSLPPPVPIHRGYSSSPLPLLCAQPRKVKPKNSRSHSISPEHQIRFVFACCFSSVSVSQIKTRSEASPCVLLPKQLVARQSIRQPPHMPHDMPRPSFPCLTDAVELFFVFFSVQRAAIAWAIKFHSWLEA